MPKRAALRRVSWLGELRSPIVSFFVDLHAGAWSVLSGWCPLLSSVASLGGGESRGPTCLPGIHVVFFFLIAGPAGILQSYPSVLHPGRYNYELCLVPD